MVQISTESWEARMYAAHMLVESDASATEVLQVLDDLRTAAQAVVWDASAGNLAALMTAMLNAGGVQFNPNP